MNTFNHIGMLLLSYLALYAAFRSGKAHLKYKKFQKALDTLHKGASEISTNHLTKIYIWLGVCIFSIIFVFKLDNRDRSSKIKNSLIYGFLPVILNLKQNKEFEYLKI